MKDLASLWLISANFRNYLVKEMTESHSISSPQFIDKVYEICKAYNPDIVEASSFKEVLEQLQKMNKHIKL